MYWYIGKRIFEKEQQGKERADYGSYLLDTLSRNLTPVYGSGFSVRQLEMCRKFYRTYPIANTLCSQLNWLPTCLHAAVAMYLYATMVSADGLKGKI